MSQSIYLVANPVPSLQIFCDVFTKLKQINKASSRNKLILAVTELVLKVITTRDMLTFRVVDTNMGG